jgi:hypothetical protein
MENFPNNSPQQFEDLKLKTPFFSAPELHGKSNKKRHFQKAAISDGQTL